MRSSVIAKVKKRSSVTALLNSGAAPATVSKLCPLSKPLRRKRGKANGSACHQRIACKPGDRPASWSACALCACGRQPRRCGGQRSGLRAGLLRRAADRNLHTSCHQSRVSVRRFTMWHKSLLSFSVFSCLIFIAVGACARADEAQVQPTIEVTASRVAETVDASLADVSIITRQDIDASDAPDLIDLLRLQAGVDVARSGGAGEQTSVFLRGTNSNHVLVLIDGVRVASSNTGAFAFENLPLDAVERVEIVRGPRASYWGSDAIGGVIQIFTRKLDSAHLAASYGSYRSADGSVGFGSASRRPVVSACRWAHATSTVFRRRNPGLQRPTIRTIYNPDDNGFQNHNVIAQGSYQLGAQTLSASVFRSEGECQFRQRRPGRGLFHHPRSGHWRESRRPGHAGLATTSVGGYVTRRFEHAGVFRGVSLHARATVLDQRLHPVCHTTFDCGRGPHSRIRSGPGYLRRRRHLPRDAKQFRTVCRLARARRRLRQRSIRPLRRQRHVRRRIFRVGRRRLQTRRRSAPVRKLRHRISRPELERTVLARASEVSTRAIPCSTRNVRAAASLAWTGTSTVRTGCPRMHSPHACTT